MNLNSLTIMLAILNILLDYSEADSNIQTTYGVNIMLIAIIFISISAVTILCIIFLSSGLILLHIILCIYGITTLDLSRGRRA